MERISTETLSDLIYVWMYFIPVTFVSFAIRISIPGSVGLD